MTAAEAAAVPAISVEVPAVVTAAAFAFAFAAAAAAAAVTILVWSRGAIGIGIGVRAGGGRARGGHAGLEVREGVGRRGVGVAVEAQGVEAREYSLEQAGDVVAREVQPGPRQGRDVRVRVGTRHGRPPSRLCVCARERVGDPGVGVAMNDT